MFCQVWSVLTKLRFKQFYLKQTVSNFYINEWLYLALRLFNAQVVRIWRHCHLCEILSASVCVL